MKGKKLKWLIAGIASVLCVSVLGGCIGTCNCNGNDDSSSSSEQSSVLGSSSEEIESSEEIIESSEEVASSEEIESSEQEESSEEIVSSEEIESSEEVESTGGEESSVIIGISSDEPDNSDEEESVETPESTEISVGGDDSDEAESSNEDEVSSEIESSEEHICVFGDWYETTPATCETVGEERRDCECGEFETRELETSGHSWSPWSILKDVDCYHWGEQTRYCEVCEEVEEEIIPALEHDVENDVCKNCSVDLSGYGITFVLNEDGESYCASSWAYSELYVPFCVIPSIYKGLPVTRIGENFFELGAMAEDEYSYYHVVTMEIPSSITSIEMRSLGFAVKLVEIYDRSGLMERYQGRGGIVNIYTQYEGQSIINVDEECYITYPYEGEIWLAGCTENKEAVDIPDNVTAIGAYAFGRCYDIEQVYIPYGVKRIEYSAFYYCKNLLSISIPDSVTTIGYSAFNQCHSLISVSLGSGLETIQKNSFKYCVRLTEVYYITTSEWYFWHWDNEDLSSALYKYTTPAPSKLSIDTDGWIYCTDGLEKILVGYIGEDENWEIPNDITSIGKGAFYNSNNLTEIVIPEGVTSIGKNAFGHCSNLSEVEISDSVTKIGKNAFGHCSNLNKITIPDSVTELEEYVFGEDEFSSSDLVIYCEAVNKPIGWSEKWSYYSEYSSYSIVWDCLNNDVADNGCIYITVDNFDYTIINGGARLEKSMLDVSNVNIPSEIIYNGVTYSVTVIGDAFRGCYNLTEVVIPDSVTSILGSAFNSCYNLTKIVIPSTVEYIARNAFYGCNALTIYCEAYSQPSRWDSSWNEVLYKKYCPVVWDCQNNDMTWDGYRYAVIDGMRYSLHETEKWDQELINEARVVGQPRNLTIANIPSEVMYNGVTYNVRTIDGYAFYECKNLIEVVIPNSIRNIGEYAFSGCSGLIEVIIPNSVRDIGAHAFSGCNGLIEVALPDSITWINDYTFSGCMSLTNVTLGSNLSWIGQYAFSGCISLTKIVIPQSVNTINEGAFGSCTNLLVIYCEAISKPDNWNVQWNTSAPVVWGYKSE